MTQEQFNWLLVERASDMAHNRMIIDFIINTPLDKEFNENDLWVSDGGDGDDSQVYTDEAQDVFNFYYEEYFEQLINTYQIPLT
jgi:hypothetical protein